MQCDRQSQTGVPGEEWQHEVQHAQAAIPDGVAYRIMIQVSVFS